MTQPHIRQRHAALLLTIVASMTLAACDGTAHRKNEMRFVTDDFVIRVSAESLPVRALEATHWKVVVSELKTGKPVENGQGRIFGTNKDHKTTANGLAATGELGTYRTNMMFVTAGLWAMALQFRRDSTQMLQKTQDWTQDVMSANEPGGIETPVSNRLPDPDSARRADAVRKADSIAMAARKKKS